LERWYNQITANKGDFMHKRKLKGTAKFFTLEMTMPEYASKELRVTFENAMDMIAEQLLKDHPEYKEAGDLQSLEKE
jgi:hypothetical protein